MTGKLEGIYKGRMGKTEVRECGERKGKKGSRNERCRLCEVEEENLNHTWMCRKAEEATEEGIVKGIELWRHLRSETSGIKYAKIYVFA